MKSRRIFAVSVLTLLTVAAAFILDWPASGQTGTDPAATAAGVLNAAGGLYSAVAGGMTEVSADHTTIQNQANSISSLQSRTSLNFTQTITPVTVPAQSCADQSFPAPGVLAGNFTIAQAPSGGTLGQISMQADAPIAGNIRLHFCNPTVGAVTPPAGIYKIAVLR